MEVVAVVVVVVVAAVVAVLVEVGVVLVESCTIPTCVVEARGLFDRLGRFAEGQSV